jgi:hypothetical protein
MPYYQNGSFLIWYDSDKPSPRVRVMTIDGLATVRYDPGRRVIQPFIDDSPAAPKRRRDSSED